MPIKNNLTSQNICEIIKQCGNSGVVKLDFNELHVSFQVRKDDCYDCLHMKSPGQVTAISPVLDEYDLLRQDEAIAKEEELSEMRIQDPMQYEELLAQQELESGEDYA